MEPIFISPEDLLRPTIAQAIRPVDLMDQYPDAINIQGNPALIANVLILVAVMA
jgi:hypothetical protein